MAVLSVALTTTGLFWLSFAVTVAALVAALITGARGRRRVHLVVAPGAMVLLAITILIAERLGRARDFPPDEMAIHLLFAKSAALLALPVIASGLWLWRTSRGRNLHRISLVLFLVTTAVATGTGIWVFSLSTLR
jgi:hypothetical protein